MKRLLTLVLAIPIAISMMKKIKSAETAQLQTV